MLARIASIGYAPPTPFVHCQPRSVKAAAEVFPWRRSIAPCLYRPLRSGIWRVAASASETPTDVEVPDVTTAIERSIQRAVERASAMEPKPKPPPPAEPAPLSQPPPEPEKITTFKETVPAQPSPSTVDVGESSVKSAVEAPVKIPEPPPAPELVQSPPDTIIMKTPDVPKPVDFSKIAPPEVSDVKTPIEPPVSAPIDSPVSAPIDPPVSASIDPPVSAPIDPPVSAPIDPPVSAPIDPPISAPVDPPVSPSISLPELPSKLPAGPKLPEGISTGNVKAAADKAISGVKNAAGQTLSGVQDAAGQTVSGVKKAAGQALLGVQDAAKRAADQATSGVQKAADQTVLGIQQTADKAASGAKQAAANSVNSVVGAASDKAGQVKDVGTDAGKKLQGVLTYGTDSISNSYKGALKGVGDSIEAGKQAVESNVITPVKSTAASAVDQVVGSIPAEVKGAVGATVRPVVNHPVASLLAVSTLAGIYAVVTIRNRFTYRAPTVTPFEALGLLEAGDEPALLVDLRPVEEQVEMGIPRLRKKAFGKGTGVEVYRLPARLATKVRNQTQAEASITAAYIAGQEKASILTRIILMGSQSEDYKSIVDALRAIGCSQVAVMDGGFASWVSAGLPVNASPTATYDTGTLDAITEYAQVFADGLPPLEGPADYARFTAVGVVVAWALYNYAFLLQMVGVIGPLVSGSIILINDYDNPGEFFKEMTQLTKNTKPELEQEQPKEKEASKSVNGDPGAA